MIYYIACTATQRLKIGYTRGEPEVRLKALQTGAPAPLRLMAAHEGDIEHERYLHEKFANQRVCGEWFEMDEHLFEHLCMAIWLAGAQCAETGEPAPLWVKSGLRMMADGIAELPPYLAALTE